MFSLIKPEINSPLSWLFYRWQRDGEHFILYFVFIFLQLPIYISSLFEESKYLSCKNRKI